MFARALVFDVLVIVFAISAATFAGVVARASAAIVAGFSRTTSCGDLSSRTPLNAAWRTMPSEVQPRKFTSITVFGSTQRTSERRASARGIWSKGGAETSSGCSRFHKSRAMVRV